MLDWLQFLADPAFRIALYLASITVAGSVLLLVSLSPARGSDTEAYLLKQIKFAVPALVIIEALRFAIMLLGLTDWDTREAFSGDMIALGAEIGPGQAIILRIIAAIAVWLIIKRSRLLTVLPASLIIAAFMLEGHTASSEIEGVKLWILKGSLAIHLMVFHWWLAILWPLHSLANQRSNETAAIAHKFGKQALFAVPLLLIAGVTLFVILTNLKFPQMPDLANPYQRMFLVKLVLVAGILLVAALNKLMFTPALKAGTTAAYASFAKSLKLEMLIALAITAATAVAIFFGLEM